MVTSLGERGSTRGGGSGVGHIEDPQARLARGEFVELRQERATFGRPPGVVGRCIDDDDGGAAVVQVAGEPGEHSGGGVRVAGVTPAGEVRQAFDDLADRRSVRTHHHDRCAAPARSATASDSSDDQRACVATSSGSSPVTDHVAPVAQGTRTGSPMRRFRG